jgi:phasin family protein
MTKQTTIDPTAVPDAPLPNLDTVQSKLNSGLAKAQDVNGRVLAYGRGNIDATVQSNRVWADGTRTILDRVLSAVKTAGRQTIETGKALAAARSPEAFVAAQANGVRAALERVSTEAQSLAETASGLAKQSLAVIADRADAAGAIFKQAA